MHTAKLRKVGGSVMLAVPPALLDILQLRAGVTVGMAVDAGRLVVEPQPQPRYTLAQLLADCDPAAAVSDDDRQWVEGAPVGSEIV